MKHKQDAIDEANEVIKLHIEDGLDEKQAEKAAAITIEYALSIGLYPGTEPIHQRAKNYLYSIIYGEEVAIKLHDLETQLRKEYRKMQNFDYQHYENQKLRSIELKQQIDQIKKPGEQKS